MTDAEYCVVTALAKARVAQQALAHCAVFGDDAVALDRSKVALAELVGQLETRVNGLMCEGGEQPEPPK